MLKRVCLVNVRQGVRSSELCVESSAGSSADEELPHFDIALVIKCVISGSQPSEH